MQVRITFHKLWLFSMDNFWVISIYLVCIIFVFEHLLWIYSSILVKGFYLQILKPAVWLDPNRSAFQMQQTPVIAPQFLSYTCISCIFICWCWQPCPRSNRVGASRWQPTVTGNESWSFRILIWSLLLDKIHHVWAQNWDFAGSWTWSPPRPTPLMGLFSLSWCTVFSISL